jgi:hypothetical protein
MTAYTPTFKVFVDSEELTDVTIVDFTITSGRTDIYQQPVAGYCQLQLLNLNNSSYDFNIGSGLTVEVTDSIGAYIPIFGGLISDFTITVNNTGELGYTTVASVTALGALSKLPKIIDEGVLSGGDKACAECGGTGMVYEEPKDIPEELIAAYNEYRYLNDLMSPEDMEEYEKREGF